MSARHDIEVEEGSGLVIPLSWYDALGRPTVLTGWTPTAKVRSEPAPASSLLATLTAALATPVPRLLEDVSLAGTVLHVDDLQGLTLPVASTGHKGTVTLMATTVTYAGYTRDADPSGNPLPSGKLTSCTNTPAAVAGAVVTGPTNTVVRVTVSGANADALGATGRDAAWYDVLLTPPGGSGLEPKRLVEGAVAIDRKVTV